MGASCWRRRASRRSARRRRRGRRRRRTRRPRRGDRRSACPAAARSRCRARRRRSGAHQLAAQVVRRVAEHETPRGVGVGARQRAPAAVLWPCSTTCGGPSVLCSALRRTPVTLAREPSRTFRRRVRTFSAVCDGAVSARGHGDVEPGRQRRRRRARRGIYDHAFSLLRAYGVSCRAHAPAAREPDACQPGVTATVAGRFAPSGPLFLAPGTGSPARPHPRERLGECEQLFGGYVRLRPTCVTTVTLRAKCYATFWPSASPASLLRPRAATRSICRIRAGRSAPAVRHR